MDIMVELHTLWNLPTAKRIFRALEEFEPFWFEDPIKMTSADDLAELAASTSCRSARARPGDAQRVSRAAGARRGRRRDAGPELGRRPVEARKIAAMAETYSPAGGAADCTGPVVYTASVHLS